MSAASAAKMMLAMVPKTVTATLPEKYTAVTKALAECVRIDECKDWSDKSAALASYARQAKDKALFRMTKRIQARAMRHIGVLLKEVSPARNQHDVGACGDAPTSRTDAARRAGLSRDQKVTALRVASVPEAEFERQVESETPPTVTALAEHGRHHDGVGDGIDHQQGRLGRGGGGDGVEHHAESAYEAETKRITATLVARINRKNRGKRLGLIIELARKLDIESEFEHYIRQKAAYLKNAEASA